LRAAVTRRGRRRVAGRKKKKVEMVCGVGKDVLFEEEKSSEPLAVVEMMEWPIVGKEIDRFGSKRKKEKRRKLVSEGHETSKSDFEEPSATPARVERKESET
jgi:hypothetical protein